MFHDLNAMFIQVDSSTFIAFVTFARSFHLIPHRCSCRSIVLCTSVYCYKNPTLNNIYLILSYLSSTRLNNIVFFNLLQILKKWIGGVYQESDPENSLSQIIYCQMSIWCTRRHKGSEKYNEVKLWRVGTWIPIWPTISVKCTWNNIIYLVFGIVRLMGVWPLASLYTRACLEIPPNWPPRYGLSRQVVFGI